MQKIIRTIFNVILIFTFAISNQPVQAKPLIGMALYNSLPKMTGVTRVQIHWDNEYQEKRLEKLGITTLEYGDKEALVLVTDAQLEVLARLRYEIGSADDFGLLLAREAQSSSLFAEAFQPVAQKLSAMKTLDAMSSEKEIAVTGLIRSLSPIQIALAAEASSIDDDADGLTNTQEGWWCTNPDVPDTDNDGITDGEEIQIIKDWVGNRRAGPPGGTPWPNWPFNDTTCPDKDHDSIPNLAERWDLGLHMDRESTDFDKFDDGQEVFGVTYCPGGDLNCGYGDLPRSSDSGYVGANMPAWVKSPGNHPFVAAFPDPIVEVLENSLSVQTVTTITTDHVISSGTEKSYSTAKTEGTSTSVANTITWNEWQEVSESLQERVLSNQIIRGNTPGNSWFSDWKKKIIETQNYQRAQAIAQEGCATITNSIEGGGEIGLKPLGIGGSVSGNLGSEYGLDSEYTGARCRGALRRAREISEQFATEFPDEQNKYFPTDIRFDPLITNFAL